jgi:lambda family phage portal protein
VSRNAVVRARLPQSGRTIGLAPSSGGFLDRFLGELGLRPRAASQRSFDAAQFTRLTNDFMRAWIASPMQDVRYDLRTLRARARDLERNDPHAKRFFRLLEKNVVGTDGVTLIARAAMLRGGGLHTDANAAIESAWADFCRVGNCTVDRQQGLVDFAKLVLRTMARDGEVFIRRWKYFDNTHGYALQIVDADLFDETFDVRALPNGNVIKMSIELDPFGAPVAYHAWNQHPQDVGWGNQPLARDRIPASEIWHLFVPQRAGQPRGVTWLNAVMLQLKKLGGYEEAELTAARVAAAKMGFITTDGSDEGPDPSSVDLGDGSLADGDRLMDASPGSIDELAPGQKFQSWDPQHPSGNYSPFTNAIIRSLAVGLDVAAHSLSGDLSQANYGSLRTGLLDERDTYRELQGLLVRFFYDQCYREWVPCAQLTGALALAGPAQRFYAVKWRARGFPWIDPLKDSQAAIIDIDNGLTSRTRVVAERGEDFEDVLADLVLEKQLADKAGITFGVAGTLPTSQAAGDGQDTPATSDGSGDATAKSRALPLPVVPLRIARTR